MGRSSLLLLAAAVALIFAATTSEAAGGVYVARGNTVSVALPRQPRIIAVEDKSVAAMTVTPDGRALVTGLRAGRTRIVGKDYAEVPIIIPVTVFDETSKTSGQTVDLSVMNPPPPVRLQTHRRLPRAGTRR